MKAIGLLAYLNRVLNETLENYDNTLIITLNENSIGPRAGVGIDNIYFGFDWEQGQLRIEPSEPLVRSSMSRDVEKEIKHNTWKNAYCCPNCSSIIQSLEHKYCPNCGQRIIKPTTP